MRFLCISDIHGHRAALEAVLARGRLEGYERLLVCGDLCFPGPDPLGVWRLLTEQKALVVQGLGDKALSLLDPAHLKARSPDEAARLERMVSVRRELGELVLARLARLPPIAHLPLEDGSTLALVHGSPADPTEPLTGDLDDDEIDRLIGEDRSELIVCGGDHVPFERALPHVRVVGTGSVGEGAAPGFASAALIETSRFGFETQLISIAL